LLKLDYNSFRLGWVKLSPAGQTIGDACWTRTGTRGCFSMAEAPVRLPRTMCVRLPILVRVCPRDRRAQGQAIADYSGWEAGIIL